MKRLQFFLFLFIFGILFFIPYNAKALGNEVVRCDYQFVNRDGKKIDLKYYVYSDGKVKLPFANNSNYSFDDSSWYHGSDFSEIYYKTFKVNNFTVTCPSIYVQENDLNVTIYAKPIYKDSCSGNCYNLTAKSLKLSKWARDNKIKSKKVVSNCAGSSIGFYNRKSYVFPYFRLYSDGVKEWSIDGSNYFPLTNTITGKINSNEKFSISLDDAMINYIFSDSNLKCPSKIYRCVSKIDGGYSYLLSTSASHCNSNDLSTLDGQAFGSQYYNGAFGDPNNDDSNKEESKNDPITIEDLKEDLNSYNPDAECSAILGSTEDDESVAWLLQQVLNYIKILGPILVVILSSMDFAKAIVASDDENMKKAEKKLVIRLVLAVALFLIPTLVSVLLDIFGITTNQVCGLK